jgi:hypothetical protein
MTIRTVLLAALLFTSAPPGGAQTLPVLPAEHVHAILQEVSGDAAYEHIRHNTQFHRPRGGADGLWTVAEYYEARAREYGLADVRLIKQAYTTRPWNARFAELSVVGERQERIASTVQTPLHIADFSRAADVTADLVDVGEGTERDFEGRDVAGKVLLTHGPLAAIMREGVVTRGAAGLAWYPGPFAEGTGIDAGGFNAPDQVRWASVPSEAIDGREPTFAFVLAHRQGVELRNRLARAKAPLRVRAQVDAGFTSMQGEQPWQVMVEAFIRGTDPEAGQDVVLTGHMQEEGTSANDDASGTASTLEVARALNRLIGEGRLPRPRRNLRFWWLTEFSSQRQYFADHPDAHRQMWVNVNQDMVGANQAQDVMRKQNVTRLPATRFHFFNDVVEAVVEYMVRSNTFELAQAQNGIPFYPNPHVSRLGTRHRYNAEMIFFHGNTDHVPFNEAPIGVPGITFTNMPDRFIHSTDDDLWTIDRTQLGRNGAAAALIAYAMATADARTVPAIASEVMGRGGQRIARNLGLGLSWIARGGDPADAYHRAVAQVRYAGTRERRAVASLVEIAADAGTLVEVLQQLVGDREAQALRELEAACRAMDGSAPGARPPHEGETALSGLRPRLVAGPTEFLAARAKIKPVEGLHNLMAFEVLNAVDGRRSGFDIFELVAAEAREAGEHYYGSVTADAVRAYLEHAAAAGVIALQ